jgi:hypothetical protein
LVGCTQLAFVGGLGNRGVEVKAEQPWPISAA